jgi:hypothetical protein
VSRPTWLARPVGGIGIAADKHAERCIPKMEVWALVPQLDARYHAKLWAKYASAHQLVPQPRAARMVTVIGDSTDR